VKDFISVAPFFAWQRLHNHMQAKGAAISHHSFNIARDITNR